jgi:hypothetical protein
MLLQERLQRVRYVVSTAAALPQLTGDLVGHVVGPAGSGVEGDDADGIAILPLHQMPHQNRTLGILLRRLALGAAQLAKIVQHKIDVVLRGLGHNRR